MFKESMSLETVVLVFVLVEVEVPLGEGCGGGCPGWNVLACFSSTLGGRAPNLASQTLLAEPLWAVITA
jgi:hypothetical protein